MRRFVVAACAVAPCVLALGISAAGCGSGDEPQAHGSSASPGATAPHTLAPVSLPDSASKLAALMQRQMRAMPTVHTTLSSHKGGEAVRVDAAIDESRGGRPAATIKLAETSDHTTTVTHGVTVNGTFYLRVEGQQQQPGKPWLSIGPRDLNNPKIGPFKKIFQAILTELNGAINQAKGGGDLAVVKLGTLTAKPARDTVGGTRVTRYTGRTSVAKYAAQEQNETAKALDQSGVKSFPWTIWVDGTGLPRKATINLHVGKTAGTGKNGVTFAATDTYADWGKPVQVTVPSKSQVIAITDYTGG